MENFMTVIGIGVAIVAIAFLVFIYRTFHGAFIAEKDERMQMIVTKSMAQSFMVFFIFYVAQFIFQMISFEGYQRWWDNFTNGFYMHPMVLSLFVLGIVLFINKRKFSAGEMAD